MKKFAGLLCILSLLFVVACAPVHTPAGTKGVLFTEAKFPGTATGEKGSKVGTAESESLLCIISRGDASIETAAKNGGITKIKTVDYKVFSILGLYGKLTTVVTGD